MITEKISTSLNRITFFPFLAVIFLSNSALYKDSFATDSDIICAFSMAYGVNKTYFILKHMLKLRVAFTRR